MAPRAASLAALPFSVRRVSAGELPFLDMRLEGGSACVVPAVLDTGSPLTMVSPEAAAEAGLRRGDTSGDVVTAGVDGQPTPLQVHECARAVLGGEGGESGGGGGGGGSGGGGLVREATRCWVGTLPLMQACGLAGRPNALVGLDLLRGDGRRTVVLDFDESKVWVER